MIKEQACPHCGHINRIEVLSPDEKFKANIGENVAKAALVTAVSIATLGWGLVLGGVFYGASVAKYAAGKEVTCTSCSRTFRFRD